MHIPYGTMRNDARARYVTVVRNASVLDSCMLLAVAGIVEPVKGGVEAGLRLGVGKAEQDTFYMAADNVVRKKLEVVLQADEDQSRRDRREVRSILSLMLIIYRPAAGAATDGLAYCCVWKVKGQQYRLRMHYVLQRSDHSFTLMLNIPGLHLFCNHVCFLDLSWSYPSVRPH